MQQAEALREDTIASHRRAVERVITSARERLCEPISLRDMSRVAYLSPFHFNRVFHEITGLPPAKFISAMRLDEAKRLLLNTHLSITDICYEVGYNSLGTFTRRFTQRVGLGPREFRYLAERITPASVESLCAHYSELTRSATGHPSVEGFVDSSKTAEGPIFVGLFPAHIPQSRPAGGALLTSPGAFRIGPVPDGTYHLLAAALPRPADTLGYLLPDTANLSVGAGNGPVIVRQGRASGPSYISLRPMALTDPPLLVSLPFLLAETLK
jgi:AraC family transcriptional regulator